MKSVIVYIARQRIGNDEHFLAKINDVCGKDLL